MAACNKYHFFSFHEIHVHTMLFSLTIYPNLVSVFGLAFSGEDIKYYCCEFDHHQYFLMYNLRVPLNLVHFTFIIKYLCTFPPLGSTKVSLLRSYDKCTCILQNWEGALSRTECKLCTQDADSHQGRLQTRKDNKTKPWNNNWSLWQKHKDSTNLNQGWREKKNPLQEKNRAFKIQCLSG